MATLHALPQGLVASRPVCVFWDAGMVGWNSTGCTTEALQQGGGEAPRASRDALRHCAGLAAVSPRLAATRPHSEAIVVSDQHQHQTRTIN